MFLAVARALPDHQFILVGGSSLPEGWCPLANVRLVGRRPYDSVANYMAAMDCLIMPWNTSEWIKACNPIKLKEYLAVGRPVVTRPFAALAPYRDMVRVAETAEDFAAAVKAACAEPYDAAPARALLTGEDWDDKAALVADAFMGLGAGAVGVGVGGRSREEKVAALA